MSALPPKADVCGAIRDVRFVPIADIRELICANRKTASRGGLSENPAGSNQPLSQDTQTGQCKPHG